MQFIAVVFLDIEKRFSNNINYYTIYAVEYYFIFNEGHNFNLKILLT